MEVKLVKFKSTFITDEYLSWLNNDELMMYSENRHKVHTIESCIEYHKTFLNSKNLLYAIVDSHTNNHVGNINAYIDEPNCIADIGILIGKVKKGYGFLAWTKMIDLLFKTKNIRKITAGTMSGNIPMLKIFKRSNMLYEYTKKDQFIFKNELMDLVGYSLFKKDYI